MKIEFDADDLKPLVEQVVAEVVANVDRIGQNDNRLAYLEGEAAALLGAAQHQLRDARLRGEISSTKVGGRIAYTKASLIDYLRPVAVVSKRQVALFD